MDVMNNALDIFSLSMIFALIGFSVHLTTSVINTIDLTCDGSLVLGACAYWTLLTFGINPVVAFTVATSLGIVAGFVTSSLTTHAKIQPIIAGIITLSLIQTFVLKIFFAGKDYLISLDEVCNITPTPHVDNAVIMSVTVLIVGLMFHRLLDSEYGLTMKVIGEGKVISESLGIDYDHTLGVSLGIANGLAAAAGALITQVIGSFSMNMGAGALVFGLTAIIAGGKIISPTTAKRTVLSCFIGSVICKVFLELCAYVCTYAGEQVVRAEFHYAINAVMLIFLMALINDQKRRNCLDNF